MVNIPLQVLCSPSLCIKNASYISILCKGNLLGDFDGDGRHFRKIDHPVRLSSLPAGIVKDSKQISVARVRSRNGETNSFSRVSTRMKMVYWLYPARGTMEQLIAHRTDHMYRH